MTDFIQESFNNEKEPNTEDTNRNFDDIKSTDSSYILEKQKNSIITNPK